MKNLVSFFFEHKKLSFLGVFILSLLIRGFLIYKSPAQNRWIDLNIYIDSGQLITNGINPYNYNDSPGIRSKLRSDSVAFGWQCETQDRWNFYASGNLPLTILTFGLIDSLSTGNPLYYRLAFAFFESLLAALVFLFCLRFWKIKPGLFNLVLLLGLGACSPTLLTYGTVYPEDKCIQTLLMLATVYFALDRNWFVSAICLSGAIAFKGLGVFIAPMAVFFAMGSPVSLALSSKQIKLFLKYTGVVLVLCFMAFAPFLPEIVTMMSERMKQNLITTPQHESIWLQVYAHFPNNWEWIRNIFVGLFSLGLVGAFLFRKINIPALCTGTLVLFTLVLLQRGSLDRMNIAMVFSILMVGMTDLRLAKILGWFSILAGSIIFYVSLFGKINEEIASVYCGVFVLLFTSFILKTLLFPPVKPVEFPMNPTN